MKRKSCLLFVLCALVSCGGQNTVNDITNDNTQIKEEENEKEDSKENKDNESNENDKEKENDKEDNKEGDHKEDPETPKEKYELDPTKESLYSNQKYLNYLGDIQDVWKEYRGDNVTLAIIDSGFAIDHAEFKFADGKSKILANSAYFSFDGSKVNVTKGVDKVKITNGDSHGTICATVAAGSVTGSGTVGVAPNANLLLLKVDGKPQSVNEAFKYAADNGAKVLSISLGSYNNEKGDLQTEGIDLTSFFDDATKYAHDKGMVICSAAGNGGLSRPTEYTYPGASSYVIGCGGLKDQSRTELWNESSYNSSKKYQFCDVFAPGNNLYSGCFFDDNGKHYDYAGGFNGTSFSSPIVAGAAALYFEKYPNATNFDFERALFNTCTKLSPSEKTGYGAIHIKNLMNYKIPQDAIKTYYLHTSSWRSADNAASYMFAWNYALTIQNKDFPGAKLTKISDYYYSFELDSTLYSYVMFTRRSQTGADWNARTRDVELCELGFNDTINISNNSTWYDDANETSVTFSKK